MTKAELLGLIIGSVGTVAAIIAAWASVAERLEKRAERKSLDLHPLEEALLYLAAQAPGEEIRVGSHPSVGGFLVVPSWEGAGLVIQSQDALKRLVNSEYLSEHSLPQFEAHGPPVSSPMGTGAVVIHYRLTIQGRKRAQTIRPNVARTAVAHSGFKGNF